jgi:hypothetical protein
MPEFVLAHGHVVFYQSKERRAMTATHAELECAAIDDTLGRWPDMRVLDDHMLLHLEKV